MKNGQNYFYLDALKDKQTKNFAISSKKANSRTICYKSDVQSDCLEPIFLCKKKKRRKNDAVQISSTVKVHLENGWISKQMITEGEAAIPLERTLHAFRNQKKTKQSSTIVKRNIFPNIFYLFGHFSFVFVMFCQFFISISDDIK